MIERSFWRCFALIAMLMSAMLLVVYVAAPQAYYPVSFAAGVVLIASALVLVVIDSASEARYVRGRDGAGSDDFR